MRVDNVTPNYDISNFLHSVLIELDNVNLVDDSGEGESIKTVNGEEVFCKMKFTVYEVLLDQLAEEVKVNLGDDLIKYEWVKLKDLKNYKLTPPSRKLFVKLGYT